MGEACGKTIQNHIIPCESHITYIRYKYIFFWEQIKCHTNNMLRVLPYPFNIVKQHHHENPERNKRNGPFLII